MYRKFFHRSFAIMGLSMVLWLSFTGPVFAQTLGDLKDLYDIYSDAKGVYDDTKNLYTNNQKCQERGGSEKLCMSLALFCYMQEKQISSYYPKFISQLKIFDSFKLDCGDGVCYQCCYVPNQGCHTSFVGFPVINCNARYGQGTRAAGLTQITNPNAKPGQACLTTPQTCEHIPICHYRKGADIAALEKKLAQGTSHPLNWTRSVSLRAREVAKDLQACWIEYLNNYTTEKTSMASLMDTITGRGCEEWRHKVSKLYPFKWDDPLFAVKDAQSKVNLDASQLNALVQLSMFRLLASLPYFYERLASVDSRVWTEASKKAYLAKITDPDKVLLKHMSTHILTCLKKNTRMQDYKLLAVPLANEKPLNEFHGCTLGKPPLITTTYTQDGTHGVKLQIELLDSGQSNSTLPTDFPAFVVWGDGHMQKLRFASGTQTLTAQHQYDQGGRYIVQTIVQNNSGLRGFNRIVVDTQATTGSPPQPFVPDVGRIRFEDLTMHVATLTGNSSTRQFRLWARDSQQKEHLIGLSPVKVVDLFKPTSFGHLVGHNPAGLPYQTFIIRTLSVGGFATGLREKYYTVKQVSFEIYSTAKNGFVTHTLQLTPDMLKVYPKGGNTPLATSAIQKTSSGLLKIPVMQRVKNQWVIYDRVEFELSANMFKGFSLGPLSASQTWKAGTNASWKEVRPGSIEFAPVCGNKMKEPGEACDDGNRVNGDGCTDTCLVPPPGPEPKPEPGPEPTQDTSNTEVTAPEPTTDNQPDSGTEPDTSSRTDLPPEPTPEPAPEPAPEPEPGSEPQAEPKPELTSEPQHEPVTDASFPDTSKSDTSVPQDSATSEPATETSPTVDNALPTDKGCGCQTPIESPGPVLLLGLFLGLLLVRRRF